MHNTSRLELAPMSAGAIEALLRAGRNRGGAKFGIFHDR
jgi:hypothetical protein